MDRQSQPLGEGHGPSKPGTPSSWPTSQIAPFLNYLIVECGLADNTIVAYRRDLVRFAGHCDQVGLTNPISLTPLNVQQYAQRLWEEQLSTATIARHLAAVRMFLRFHLLMGLMKKDICAVLESPKTWRRVPRTLSKQRTTELLDGVDRQNPLGLRDAALLELLYATGIRASEAAGLDVDSINFQIGYLNCFGKGNKERIVPVHAKALTLVQEYVEQLRPELVGQKIIAALFVSRTGNRLSRIEVWRIVQRAARGAGMTGRIGPHTLRHCFGSHMLQGGADLRVVQELLGHADVATTQIYTHVDQEHLRDMHKRYHPRP